MPTKSSLSKGASRQKNASSAGNSSLRSFSFGLVIGIFTCLLIQRLLTADLETPSQTQIEGNEPQADAVANAETRPEIDFYTRLQDSEVLVPVPAPVAPREPVIYYLQAASFRNAEDANRARAELLLLNLETEVTTQDINGETWHRIIVGPFDGQSKVSKAQTTLLENGYGGMVMQRKK